MKKHKKIIVISIVCIVFVSFIVWVIWGNTALELNTYTVTGDELPQAFENFRIAQVSDLHNAELGENNEKLLVMLRDASPDIIVITGDLIDSRTTNVEIALEFANDAVMIAPCYYVTGNHEARVNEYKALKEGLLEIGVTVLEDERITLERDGEKITLIGVNDPSFNTDYLLGDEAEVMKSKLDGLVGNADGFTILLSHRPELFETYVESSVELVISGHAHGGQVRIPFVGGIYAPGQGLFPKYDSGIYTKGNTDMIVSRGVGNSAFPIRFNNRPEVIIIELWR